MNLKSFKPILETCAIAILAFILHKAFFYFFYNKAENHLYYNLTFLYAFFCAFSIIIILILIKIKKKNIDSVGQAFMLLTCIKMVAAYVLLHPILQLDPTNSKIEKIDFFMVFALFLAIETIVTIRILNNKQ